MSSSVDPSGEEDMQYGGSESEKDYTFNASGEEDESSEDNGDVQQGVNVSSRKRWETSSDEDEYNDNVDTDNGEEDISDEGAGGDEQSNTSLRISLSASQPLIRRQKAHLYQRQKKWSDTFSSSHQMTEFVARELLSNASDAILRLVNESKEGDCGLSGGFRMVDGRIDIKVTGVGARTVLLEVKDNGDGCEDFAKSIMTEGTSANQEKDGAVTTGGKGSAKDCFSVQDAFSFVSKKVGKETRYFSGSQDLALEHSSTCSMLDLTLDENRGWAAESRLEQKQKCICMVTALPSSSRSNYHDHGTTVVLALAPIVTDPKKKASKCLLSTRVRKIQDTVRRIIEYTVGENGGLDGIEFTLNGEEVKPKLSIEPKKHELEANRLISKSKFTRFNKDLECYKGTFEGDLYEKSLVVVVAETGMFQFFKEVRTNHRKKVTVVIKCSKSCKQLDANRSQFRSDGHKDIFEELKRRISEVGDIEAIMSPEVGNLDPDELVKDYSEVSSTDPIGALLSASIGVEDVNGVFSLGPMKKEQRERIRQAIKKKKEMFAKKQSRELAVLPVAAQGHLSMMDPRITLARHTSQHIDYLVEKSRSSSCGVIPSPIIFGTKQQTRLKLYRIFCIAVNMVYSARDAARILGMSADLCSSEVRVVLDIRDDHDGNVVHATHNHQDGKCVIGINLLRLVDGKAEIRHDTKGMDMMQKSMMSLLDTVIHEVAHCITRKHSNKNECGRDHCIHFYETESKLRSHLISSGVTLQRQCIPSYVKGVCKFSKMLHLETIPAPRVRKKKPAERPVSVRVYLTRSRAVHNRDNSEGDGNDIFSEAGSNTCSRYNSDDDSDGKSPSHYVTEASEKGGQIGSDDDFSNKSSDTASHRQKISDEVFEDSNGCFDYGGEDSDADAASKDNHEAANSPTTEMGGATYNSFRIEDAIERNSFLPSPIQPDDHWSTVSDKLEAAGWGKKEGGGLNSWHYILPSGETRARGGMEGVDYLRSKKEMKLFAIEYLGWAGDKTITNTKVGSTLRKQSSKDKFMNDDASGASTADKEKTGGDICDNRGGGSKKRKNPTPSSKFDHGPEEAVVKKKKKKRKKKMGGRFTHDKNANRAKKGTRHPLHDHPLIISTSKKGDWACDACTPSPQRDEVQQYPFSEKDKRYSCALNKKHPCDFDLCETCFIRGDHDGFEDNNVNPTGEHAPISKAPACEEDLEPQSRELEEDKSKTADVDMKQIENDMCDYSQITVPQQELVSPPSAIVFERKGVNGSHHRVSVIVGREGVKFESSLRDAMVKAKQLNAALFRSRTKAFVMEIQFSQTSLPFTIESAKTYSISDLFELVGDSMKTVDILVKDAPEMDDEESDIDF